MRRLLFCLLAAVAWQTVAAFRAPVDSGALADQARDGEVLFHGIRARSEAISYRMPLASLTTARVLHHNHLPSGLLLTAYAAVFVLLLFALTLQLHAAGSFAGAAAVVLLTTDNYPVLYTESGFHLLVLLAAGLLAWRAHEPSPRRTLLLGLALGASLLWRSPLAFLGPALFAWEWAFEPRLDRRARRSEFHALCVVPYLFLIPWIAMNWNVHGRFVPFEDGAASENIVAGALGLTQTTEGDRTGVAAAGASAGSSALLVAAGEILRHPLRFVTGVAGRVGFVLGLHPILFLVGGAAFWHFRSRRGFRALALLCTYFVLLHCVMTVEPRYFFPLWPLLAAAAGCLFVDAATRGLKTDPAETGFAESALRAGAAAALLFAFQGTIAVLGYAVQRDDSAEAQLTRALKDFPNDAWLLGERARDRLDRGETAASAEDIARAAALRPGDPALRLRLANAESLLGRHDALLGFTPPDGADDKLAIDADILKACAHLRLGHKEEARARLRAAKQAYTERNVMVRGEHGEQEQEVLDRLRAWESGFPRYCQFLQGRRPPEETLALSEALAEFVPDQRAQWLQQERRRAAQAFHESGDYKKAGALLAALSAERPKDGGLWLQRAEAAAKAGDRAAALSALDKVRTLGGDKELEDGRRVALVYQELKEFTSAVSYLGELMKRHPGAASLFSDRAVCLALSGKRKDALADLDQAMRLEAGFLPPYLTLAALHLGDGRVADAIAVYDRALKSGRAGDPLLQVVADQKREASKRL